MSKNPLFPFFAKLFSSGKTFLKKGTIIPIDNYECKLLTDVISYESECPDKQDRLRFAFVGEEREEGANGILLATKAVIRSREIHFPLDREKTYCLKLFKPKFSPTKMHEIRESEIRYASLSGKLRPKRTGATPMGYLGMIMRDFGSENLISLLRSECFVLVHNTMPQYNISEDVFNFIYLCKDKLYFENRRSGIKFEIKPSSLAEQAAYDKLKAIITAFPTRNIRYFAKKNALECIELLNHLTPGSTQPLLIKKRLKITINLFKALRDQVVVKEIAHNDIKPENIMINRKTAEITLVDYGLSSQLGAEITTVKGNMLYSSPEKLSHLLMPLKLLPSSDLYSMGKIVAFLWGADENAFGMNVKHLYFINENELILKTLFTRFDKLPSMGVQTRIRDILTSILYFDPAQRAPLDQVINDFETLLTDYRRELIQKEILGGWGIS